MRETRQSGSEGGGPKIIGPPYPYQDFLWQVCRLVVTLPRSECGGFKLGEAIRILFCGRVH